MYGTPTIQQQSRHTPPSPCSIRHPQTQASEGARNLIVNYIPSSVEQLELFEIFEQCGPIESLKIVPGPNGIDHKGYGFVIFQNHADALTAIKTLNGSRLRNKRLKVSFADRQPQPPRSTPTQSPPYISRPYTPPHPAQTVVSTQNSPYPYGLPPSATFMLAQNPSHTHHMSGVPGTTRPIVYILPPVPPANHTPGLQTQTNSHSPSHAAPYLVQFPNQYMTYQLIQGR